MIYASPIINYKKIMKHDKDIERQFNAFCKGTVSKRALHLLPESLVWINIKPFIDKQKAFFIEKQLQYFRERFITKQQFICFLNLCKKDIKEGIAKEKADREKKLFYAILKSIDK